EGKITHNEATVKRLVRRLTSEGGEVRACYEAGPTGYELQRTLERFRSPRALMAFLGLVPSEASSGAKQRRGAITKTGNSFVRRVLVEATHHCSKPPRVGVVVQRRRAGQPAEVVAIAERAQ
ncbi:unnamed protein product, partial [Laminaria digitata]